MKKRILILGANGMAGHVISIYLRQLEDIFEVVTVARTDSAVKPDFLFDLSDFDVLGELVSTGRFDYIINCVGVLNRNAEDDPANAILINSYLPHFLHSSTKDSHSRVIHISTDCVFSGKVGGYVEDDLKDGIGYYAQSKALGELNNDKDLTIRTSIIGPELNTNGIGLLNWFMIQPINKPVYGHSEAFWSGITTIELAKVIMDAIQNNRTGIKNIAPSVKISKLELLKLFNSVFRNDSIKILPSHDYQIDKSLVSERTDYQYPVPTYKQMLIDMNSWITNLNIYPY